MELGRRVYSIVYVVQHHHTLLYEKRQPVKGEDVVSIRHDMSSASFAHPLESQRLVLTLLRIMLAQKTTWKLVATTVAM